MTLLKLLEQVPDDSPNPLELVIAKELNRHIAVYLEERRKLKAKRHRKALATKRKEEAELRSERARNAAYERWANLYELREKRRERNARRRERRLEKYLDSLPMAPLIKADNSVFIRRVAMERLLEKGFTFEQIKAAYEADGTW